MDRQELAIEKILSGKNIFITGKGGVGKSYVIDKITDNTTVKCAPTGAAALLIGGMTCHKLFGLPLGLPTPEDKTLITKNMNNILGNSVVKRIVIDEVGMLRADMLDLINIKLQVLKCNTKPFGGLQIVLVGDFYQLEPVVHWTEEEEFYKNYPTPFAFSANCWDFDSIELTKSYRNINNRQLHILEAIRCKTKNYKKAVDLINEESKEYDHKKPVLHLCCYKKETKIVNKLWYSKILAPEKVYKAMNPDNWAETPVEKNISLKEGCRVVIKANDIEGMYVNGSKGSISYLGDNYVRVILDSSKEVVVPYNQWDKYTYKTENGVLTKEVESSFFQLPIALGYASTVHSAQGSTVDDIALDFGEGCFVHGQAYVALSRIKDLRNISLVEDITYEDIICKKEVKEFYETVY